MPDSFINGSHSLPLGGGGSLHLSIDASISTYRACIMNEKLEVIWVEKVDIDSEIPQFKTRDGVHTIGDSVTYPSSLRLVALDLLLEKLTHNTQHLSLIPQIVSISGSTPSATLHYLLPEFPQLLSSLEYQWGDRLSTILNPSQCFATDEVKTSLDSSTMSQIKRIEQYFGELSLSSTSSLSSSEEGQEEKEEEGKVWKPRELEEKGKEWFCSKTGGRILGRSAVGQLVQVREKDKRRIEIGEIGVGGGVLGRTERIVLESQLFSSLFVGSLVKMDASDACSTQLFNPQTMEWEQEVLDYVMGSIDEDDAYERVKGGKRLKQMLGEVERDGAKPVGTISDYMSKRFGFAPDCLIVSFTGSSPATFLSYPLSYSPSIPSSTPQREVLLSLSTSSTDTLLSPSPSFTPSPQHQLFLNPINAGEECDFVAMMSSKDAGLGRSLVKDMYCNGSWDVFGRLSAIVPHGGTLGLDDKYFSFFFPHGQGSIIQGFLRLVYGARVSEFSDRKVNPRLLLESQFFSLRLKLSRFYQSISNTPSNVGKYDILGFDKFEKEVVPTRIVVVGEMSQNPAVSSVLSGILGAPSYLLEATGLKRNQIEGEEVIERGRGESKREKLKTSAASLGSGYKAGWSYYRNEGGQQGYGEWLRGMLDAQNDFEGGDQLDDNPFEIEKYPISSLPLPPTSITSTQKHHKRFDSGYTTVSSHSEGGGGNHSRNSSSNTSSSYTSSVPPSLPSTAHKLRLTSKANAKRQQHKYDPDYDEIELRGGVKELEEDPNGLELIAMPDQDEWKYYSSMLPEFVRLQKHASKGLI